MSNKSPGMHRTSRLSVTRSASMSAKKGEKRQSIQDMDHSSLSLQKTGASSDQPLRKQKLLASHSSSTEQRCTPHTGEGRPARPWTQSAAVLPSPDRTHHSKARFKRVPSLPSQAHIQLFLWWCHPLQHYQPSLLCYETSNLSTPTCINVDRLQCPFQGMLGAFGVSEGHVETFKKPTKNQPPQTQSSTLWKQ